jgi:hypothetical protein
LTVWANPLSSGGGTCGTGILAKRNSAIGLSFGPQIF